MWQYCMWQYCMWQYCRWQYCRWQLRYCLSSVGSAQCNQFSGQVQANAVKYSSTPEYAGTKHSHRCSIPPPPHTAAERNASRLTIFTIVSNI
ncbi:hypothetical protein B484DRAFT_61442 [Ochromonadaceae sp. CCMP2298]|nr:hypothetical protein B484DRAFT_61442 [Ochromonadaceae sp. CCMP2298]